MFRKILFGLLFVLFVVGGSSLTAVALPKDIKSDQPHPPGTAAEATVSITNAYIESIVGVAGRFFIHTTGGDPNTAKDNDKNLLFGSPTLIGTSYTTLRVTNGSDTMDYALGDEANPPSSAPVSDGDTVTTAWTVDGITVEQKLSFALNASTQRQDVTNIEYKITNNNASARDAGIRVLLDTKIGDNDGSPFFIQGIGQVTQEFAFDGPNVPNYWFAYESPTFEADSLRGYAQLAGGGATRPDRLIIAHWGDDLCDDEPGLYENPWDYDPIPFFGIHCDTAAAVYYNPITLAPGASKTYRTFYGIAGAGAIPEVELHGIEVTQAIQNWENDVELLEDRATVVRAHVRSTSGPIEDAVVKLAAERNGSPLPDSPLAPSNPGLTVDIPEFPNRAAHNQSFYFDLPQEWVNGDVEFELIEDTHPITCLDHTGTDNDCKAEVSFNAATEPEIRFIGISWAANNNEHTPEWVDINSALDQLAATLPVNSIAYDFPYTIKPTFFNARPSDGLEFLRLNSMLGVQKTLDGCLSNSPTACSTYYMGVIIDPPSGEHVAGLASGIPGDIVSGYVDGRFTLAHELGHAAGRNHTECRGNELEADAAYPYANGRISTAQAGDLAFYGFNTQSKDIFGPSTGDLMSYCNPRWASDWTYKKIGEEFATRFGTPISQTQPQAPIANNGDAVFLISGFVNISQNGAELDAVYQIDSPVEVTLPSPGEYTIRFEDSDGELLSYYGFTPQEVHDAVDQDAYALFNLLLPYEANAHKISIYHYDEQLDAILASENAPTLSLTSPDGGENWQGDTAVISWNANDDDGDPLLHIIQLSSDNGATWETVAANITGSSYELDLRPIAGTTGAKVRVLASDGVFTSQDESSGPFTIAHKAPNASIQSPADSMLFVDDQLINFAGRAYDAEDGALASAALSWHSDLDGNLGPGSALSLNAATLSEGTHTITLNAEDSDNETGTAEIVIDVQRIRPSMDSSLSVSPTAMEFTVTEGAGQSDDQLLAIENGGDGAIIWSADPDSSWILLSSISSTAPTNVIVAADESGLAPGHYEGVVTVTSTADKDKTQEVLVSLNVAKAVDAEFSAAPRSGIAPLTVNYTNESTGNVATRLWDLGDGSTSNANNLIHHYADHGVYDIALTVNGPSATSDTNEKPSYIYVFGVVEAAFDANPTIGEEPLEVAFENKSSGSHSFYSWDFGDGSTSTAENPKHIYPQPGSYTISLEVSGEGGTDKVTMQDFIVVEKKKYEIYQPVISKANN